MQSLCVFCGASSGHDSVFAAKAREFGTLLARQGIELIWGGGQVGLMGVVADAVLAGEGRTHGVIPAFMAERELAHRRSTGLSIVDSMHTRKAEMARRAEAFVALPGGIGTLEELFEVFTWAQLGLHDKPIGLLNTQGFFDPLLEMLRHMADKGFVKPRHLDLLCHASEPDALLQALLARARTIPTDRPLTGI